MKQLQAIELLENNSGNFIERVIFQFVCFQ